MKNIIKTFDNIIKSPNDNRSYRGILLENQLKCLLISDPTTEKAAAALNINVGSMSDPDNLPGLAHLCEHMLFMGSKSYPIENEFRRFVSSHAGSSNAVTSNENTAFYFDISTSKFQKSLDL